MRFKIRIVGCLFSLVFSLACKTGVANKIDSLKLCVIANVVKAKLDSGSVVIPVILENNSKTDYLLYAFEKTSILDTSMDSIFFADVVANGGAGTLAIILDKTGKRQDVFFNIVSDDENLNSDFVSRDLTSIEKVGKALYINGGLLIKSMERKKVTIRISTRNIALEKGEYQLKVLYYAGKELPKVVGLTQLRSSEKAMNATTFFGSIESNIVRLLLD